LIDQPLNGHCFDRNKNKIIMLEGAKLIGAGAATIALAGAAVGIGNVFSVRLARARLD
jgi:hypothetical protein